MLSFKVIDNLMLPMKMEIYLPIVQVHMIISFAVGVLAYLVLVVDF